LRVVDASKRRIARRGVVTWSTINLPL